MVELISLLRELRLDLPVLELHGPDPDPGRGLVAPPLPDRLVDALVDLDVLALHMPGKIVVDGLHGPLPPLPPGRVLHIPEGDDVDLLLQLLDHGSHLQGGAPPGAALRVGRHRPLRLHHNPGGYAAVLFTGFGEPDLETFRDSAHVHISLYLGNGAGPIPVRPS